MSEVYDRIEKKVLLRAALERVWEAITDGEKFGSWFGVRFDGAFAPGARLIGRIAPTKVDAEVAKLQEPHTGKPFEFRIHEIQPMKRFSFYWHPYAVDPATDYSKEPMTLVTFELEQASGGTTLTIVESGFDRIPLARRSEAFKANEGGWTHQAELIQKYLAQTADG
jgi:uncharacterized protein YndB with AHSA1/START domain